jgi:thiol-disulfide isomerase/thioredoxin
MSRFASAAVALVACALAPARGAAGEDFGAWEKALASHPLKDAAGKVVRISDLKGEVVVVSFWASWCKPCKRELVALDGWLAGEGNRAAAPRILAVSVDQDERKAVRFIKDAALRLPVSWTGPTGSHARSISRHCL